MAAEFEEQDILVEGDFLVLIEQVNKVDSAPDWNIEGEVWTLRRLLSQHARWQLHWMPHDGNQLPHRPAKWAWSLDTLGDIDLGVIPPSISSCDDLVQGCVPS